MKFESNCFVLRDRSAGTWLTASLMLCLMLGSSGCQRQESPAPQTAGETSSSESSGAKDSAAQTPQKAGGKAESAETPVVLTYKNPLTAEQIEAGWLNLFDGETLFGWRKQNDINWAVQEGAIVASDGPVGLLLTEVPFADFELSLDFKLSPGGNSGVFIRCNADPQNPATDCYEINIADEHAQGWLTGSVVTRTTFDPQLKTADNEWHHLKITAVQNKIGVVIDDKVTHEFTHEGSDWFKSGLIGLQKNFGTAGYKNIQLRPLGLKDLFNGKDLSGWREVPGSKSVIDVVNGTIHVVNGPGFLETEQTFSNFITQFQAKTEAPELNSGLFFRAMPGSKEAPSNGYEVQIHNGFHDGDRNRPNNAGTGAIFRRIDARRVVSSDREWCTITLIANGPHIATWVEGYPVVSWEDTRKPDENPRKGLRLEAGHLSLQGHDPTTDMYFKNLRAAEMPQ